MFVDVAVVAGIDITALTLDRAAAAAGDRILVAAALGAARGVEASGPAVAVGLALRVHGLVWTCERARAPAAVGIDVLVRRSGNAGARVVVARIPGAAAVAPRGAAVRVAARAWVISRPGASAAVRAVDRATLCPGAGRRVVSCATLGDSSIRPIHRTAPRPGTGARVVPDGAGVRVRVGIEDRYGSRNDHRRIVVAGPVNQDSGADI